ncbi:MAG: hypothetical protein ABIR92_01360 [Gemmatimonadaceae bacterium]
MKHSLLLLFAVSTFANAQKAIPLRDLGPIEAVSKDTVGYLYGLREFSDGRVLISDATQRRLTLFDASLANAATLADSLPSAVLSYGKRPTTILPYRGDTAIFVDLAGRALLLLDANGTVVRVMSSPRPGDLGWIGNPNNGVPGFDGRGRIIYRSTILPGFQAPVKGKPYVAPSIPDSAPIIRVDFDTRIADTLAWVRTATMKVSVQYLEGGGVQLSPTMTPLSVVDDWALLPDGTVAIVRGQDYHIDWIAPDGARTSSPKMAFDWKRLTDADKVAIVDSAKRILEAGGMVGAPSPYSAPVGGGAHGGGAPAGGGNHGMTIMPVESRPDGSPPPVSNTASGAITPMPAPKVVPASELPDYLPPIARPGTMRADPDGNLWILPSTSAQSGKGLVYDIVNRSGEISSRVRLPVGRALQGFGANGAVYLTAYGPEGARIERSRLERKP